MKSLRDEIRLAAGDMDGFNFIQAFGLDFICAADFILVKARISLYNALEVIAVAENKLADLAQGRVLCDSYNSKKLRSPL